MASGDFAMFGLQLMTMLASARLLGYVVRRLGQPEVIGEIIGGIVLGPTLAGTLVPGVHDWLFQSSADAATAREAAIKLGMLFFIFVTGLETGVDDLRTVGRRALAIGLVGTLLPLAAGVGLVLAVPGLLGAEPSKHVVAAGVFLGMTLANSANPVLARILHDLGLLDDDVGRVSMAATVVDDLVNWAIFGFVAAEFASGRSPVGHGPGQRVAVVVAICGGVVLLTRYVCIPWLRRLTKPTTSPSGLASIVALTVLGAATLSEAAGVHAFLGAYLVGAVLGTRGARADEAERQAHRAVGHIGLTLFAPIYFVSLGMMTDFAAHFDLRLVVVLTFVAVVTKLAAVLAGVRLAGMHLDRRAWAIGWALNARGATGILLAGVGRDAGIIDARMFTALATMAVVTSILSGTMMRRLLPAATAAAVRPDAASLAAV